MSNIETPRDFMPEPFTFGYKHPAKRELLDALKKAKEVIDYLGDVLNAMDAVQPEDEEKVNPLIDEVDAVIKKYDV